MGEKYQRRGLEQGQAGVTGLQVSFCDCSSALTKSACVIYSSIAQAFFSFATISHRHSPGPPPRSRANAKRSLGRATAVFRRHSLLVLALPAECSCRRRERGSERDLTLRALSSGHGIAAPGHTILLPRQRSGGCCCLWLRTKARHSAGIPSCVRAPLPGIALSVLQRHPQKRKARQNHAAGPIPPRARANPCSERVRGPKATATSQWVLPCPAKETPAHQRPRAKVLRLGYK